MSTKSMAKSHDESLMDCIDGYRRAFGGGFRMEDVAQWVLDNGLLPAPTVAPVKLLTRALKQTARRTRMRDPQGRTVRKVLAAKIERLQADGTRIFDVIWDYLHEMPLDHALTAFAQRDENIEMQRRSATRDVHSCLENNPNVIGYGDQFNFAFMLEDPVEILEERIDESALCPDDINGHVDKADETNPIRAQKPR